MKKFKLEIHKYAPELNQITFENGVTMKAPYCDSIRGVKEKYFSPGLRGKFAKIEYKNRDPSLNRVYGGFCGDGYRSIITTMIGLRQKHNLGGGFFTIRITTRG